VIICPKCAEENPDRARFCLNCASPLEPSPEAREVRKTVSLVFTDLAGSTAMAERLDPETVRRVMARYFAFVSSVLERHGGTVEKFVGDAVLAVFGIPQLHEDDALRAVRAAAEMRDGLPGLNVELEVEFGVSLSVRTGVNTGEVVAGDPGSGQAFVSGDPVNVAARLEQHAGAGDILIGPDTYRLVRNAVVAEAAEPVAAKGKSEPLEPLRLLEVKTDVAGFARRPDSKLVGREHESNLLRQGFERATKESACHLFTILGPAGVGKSRLVADFLSWLPPNARVARGQCLPYGDGITYWPLAEAIRDLAGISNTSSSEEATELLSKQIPQQEGETLTNILLQLLGQAPVVNSVDELSWAVRRLFEQAAASSPLVVLIDDIHWAEAALLDTIEYVADWSRSSPILLICVARPELLDERSNWGGGKLNATSLLLEPLDAECSRALVRQFLGTTELPSDLLTKIAETAEGNPLYVEQMLEMLIDDGYLVKEGETWESTAAAEAISVPPTISALLAARLDRLQAEERRAIERASVIGRVFYSGAVREMTPASTRNDLRHNLQVLVRKELVRPAEDELVGEDSFRFGHILIRDAAYGGLPKEQRAELHKVFGEWLENRGGERSLEFQDIVAHHLYESYRYSAELGSITEEARALADRAAQLSLRSARSSMNRGDGRAAEKLLSRALELLPERSPERWDVMSDLADVKLQSGDFKEASAILDALTAEGAPERIKVRAVLMRMNMDLMLSPSPGRLEEARAMARAAISSGESSEDGRTLTKAWVVLVVTDVISGRLGAALEHGMQALEQARAVGDLYTEGQLRIWIFASHLHGPTPITEAIEQVRAIVANSASQLHATEGRGVLASLRGYAGDAPGTAPAELRAARDVIREMGEDVMWGGLGMSEAELVALSGDVEGAARVLEEACEELERLGEKSFLSTSVGLLADYLCDLGRFEEAEPYALRGKEIGAVEDIMTEAVWRSSLARVLAARGEHEEALRLMGQALELSESTDMLPMQGLILSAYGEVLSAGGRGEEARAALEEARERYLKKGALAHVVLVEDRLSRLT
jgi:class 3 adenylate cyclase/tetratricopeptide (TPR) repeat protein